MAAIPGSLFRRVLFWAHLSSAVAAGLFIFIMSATGVLLTYEHQMVDTAVSRNHVSPAAGATPLDADSLAVIARAQLPAGSPASLVFEADPTAPVTASRGRDGSVLLNPYDGSVIEDASAGRREFFRVVESWHRWLSGDSRGTGAKLIDYGNLVFLFIIVSGIYIWLPKVWRWRNLRGLMFFQRRYVNGKVRDFNWHHVFSFWMLIPLFVISLSGVVISFDWAHKLVFAAYGETAPARRAAAGAAAAQGVQRDAGGERVQAEGAPVPRASLEVLRQIAIAQTPGWNRLTLPLDAPGAQIEIALEMKSAERRPPRQTVVLDTADATVVRVQPPQANTTPAQRARTWLRFAHTGEQYGIVGQTIAGLASLAACFLVYTGLALAWRRLVRPLFRRTAPP